MTARRARVYAWISLALMCAIAAIAPFLNGDGRIPFVVP